MPTKAFVGRVGGLAVTLGVGAAIVTGWGNGLAWADETRGPAASTYSRTASGRKATKADPSDEQGPAKPGDGSIPKDAPESTTKTPPETADDGPSNRARTSKRSDSATPKPLKKETPRPSFSAVDPTSDATVPATATHKQTAEADP